MTRQYDPNTNYVWRALDLFRATESAHALAYKGRRYTYGQLIDGINTMATALLDHGVRPGGAVAVLAGTPPESVFIQFALHMLGCRSVWIAPNTPSSYRLNYLRLAEVDTFVYDMSTHAEMGLAHANAAPELKVLCFGAGGAGPDLTAAPAASASPVGRGDIEHEPQSLFQTGGTTGHPKLVHHRHHYFQALHAVSEFFLASGGIPPRHAAESGYWHASSQTAGMMTLFTGGALFMYHGFEVEEFCSEVERERLTSTLLPPPLLYQLLDHPKVATYDLSSLTMVSIGGAAAAPTRLAQALDRFGPILRPVYGMSEATFLTAYTGFDRDPDHPERLGSCGKPYADIRIEIRDDSGNPLPVGENGEIWAAGALTMSGYWGQPDLTEDALVDGWLRTGDIGHFDADGYLYIVDRAKDMIITGEGSSNVYCRPLEDVLLSHPQVRGAAVIGVPDPETGEAVHAYVVRSPGAEVTPAELRALVVSQLNGLWAPREVEFIDELPLTQSGKIDKKALREHYAATRPANE